MDACSNCSCLTHDNAWPCHLLLWNGQRQERPCMWVPWIVDWLHPIASNCPKFPIICGIHWWFDFFCLAWMKYHEWWCAFLTSWFSNWIWVELVTCLNWLHRFATQSNPWYDGIHTCAKWTLIIILPGTMQVFTITCIITFLWLVFGYSLAFSPAQLNGSVNEVYGNSDRLWLRGMMTMTSHALAPTIPEALFCAYQLTFAIITAGLICGSFADRMKFPSMMVFISFWHLMVYCPIAHSNWHPQGWLYRLGVLDYAGGNVVHVCSGNWLTKFKIDYIGVQN